MLISYILDFFFIFFLNMRKFHLVKCGRLHVSYVWCGELLCYRDWVNVEAGVSVVAGNFL